MKRVGVVVEGPCDLVFWQRLLHRIFARHDYGFDVRSLKGTSRVIQQAPQLTDDFYKAGYHSAFFILDADKSPCPREVLARFDVDFLEEIRRNRPAERFAHVFIAFREIESWILADENCVRHLLDFPGYAAPEEQSSPGGKARLLRICREHGAFPVGMQDLEFARQAAALFDPLRVKAHSPSFTHFGERLNSRLHTSES
jgi:hypothetical protein